MPLQKYIKENSPDGTLGNIDLFEIDPSGVDGLLDVLKIHGVSPEHVIHVTDKQGNVLLTEAKTKREAIFNMPLRKRYELNWAIRVPRNVHQNLYSLAEQGMRSKDWYYDINRTIFNSLGESEGTLFLMILAVTSPRNLLERNFEEASVIYMAFKKDIRDNLRQLEAFIDDVSVKADKIRYDEGSPHGNLHIFQIMRKKNIRDVSSKILNLKKTFKYYINNNGIITRDLVLNNQEKFFDLYSRTVGGILKFEKEPEAFSRNKVYNFVFNLLDPSRTIDYQQRRWYFVTIDTWMLKAFYPHMDSEQRGEVMGHQARYLHPVQIIIDISKNLGIMPHQTQASIWSGILQQNNKPVDSFAKVIEKKQMELAGENSILRDYTNAIRNIISGIYQYYLIKPEVPEEEVAPF